MELRHTVVVFIDGGHPGAPSDCAPHGLEARTRDRVSAAISEHGPITAADLGRRLGLTPAAVRRHLDALAAQGAIEEREPATSGRRRGRPARAYVLSEAGHRAMNSDYDGMATSAVPEDLAAALEAAGLTDAFAELSRQNRYSILHRVQTAKKAETRERRIAKYVGMLAAGETPH